jgi:hypothetical protein
MPPAGWKKPPGYAGYKRTSTNGRGPAAKQASRSAGVHMLRGARAAALPNLAADIGSHAASDDVSDVDDNDEVNANSEGDEGVISSCLRLRKGAPPLVDDDASMANASALIVTCRICQT